MVEIAVTASVVVPTAIEVITAEVIVTAIVAASLVVATLEAVATLVASATTAVALLVGLPAAARTAATVLLTVTLLCAHAVGVGGFASAGTLVFVLVRAAQELAGDCIFAVADRARLGIFDGGQRLG